MESQTTHDGPESCPVAGPAWLCSGPLMGPVIMASLVPVLLPASLPPSVLGAAACCRSNQTPGPAAQMPPAPPGDWGSCSVSSFLFPFFCSFATWGFKPESHVVSNGSGPSTLIPDTIPGSIPHIQGVGPGLSGGRTSWSIGPPQCPLTAAELPSAFRGQRSKGRAEVSWEGTGSPSGDIIHPFIHSLVQCPPYSGLFVWAKTQLVTRIQLYRPTTSGLGEPEKAQGGASPEQRHAKGRGQQGPRGAVSTAVLCPHLVPQAAGRSQGPRL